MAQPHADYITFAPEPSARQRIAVVNQLYLDLPPDADPWLSWFRHASWQEKQRAYWKVRG
jgi:hypothetical protein